MTKSKTNQVHFSYFTNATIKLAHLDTRVINHMSLKAHPMEAAQNKAGWILVADFKAT